MKAELLVTGRLLQADGSLARGAFTVRDGRVMGVGAHLQAEERIDFGDRLVVPGAIDPHVHFRDPGHPEKEDFASGTRSAALGGVTTVLDMPNTSPPVFTHAALADKLSRARAKAVVDFGLYCGLDDNGESLALLPGSTAMKIYLGATTGNLLVRDMDLVRRALAAAAAAGRTVAVHAESQACLDRHAHALDDSDFTSHSTSRPPECEAEAIRTLAVAAHGTSARVHIAHLSTRAGLDALRNTGFTSEATPHHLLLEQTALRGGGKFKMNPPLRAPTDVRVLWDAFVRGDITCLASDHAPHTIGEKAAIRLGECPSGVPGVQTLVPIVLARALEEKAPIACIVAASTAAARVFRLPGKGALAPGNDADFAVYDLEDVSEVRAERMASRAGWTPFEGMRAIFPTDVFVRGEAVVAEGKIVDDAPRGRFVVPA